MEKDSKAYWADRERENLEKNLKTEAGYFKEIEGIYKYTMDQVQKEIDSFYARYASKEGITMAEVKKRSSKPDMEAFSRKAEKYVKEKNFSKQANEEMRLYNLTMKVNRLELLKAQIGLELVAGFDELQQFYEEKLAERAAGEFQRQAGIFGTAVHGSADAVHAAVNASFHHATYSERIWAHQELLKAELSKLLRTGLVQGKNPKELAGQLRKVFGLSVYNSERLMRTELARVQTEAQKLSYIGNGFDEYQYVACSGTDVCPACKKLDGKRFKVGEMMPGENAPPMHPCCHCSTAAYIDDKDYNDWLNGYKGHGMSFAEWKAKNGGAPPFLDKNKMTGTQKRNAREIASMAKNTDSIVRKYTSLKSKWSGKIDFLDGSEVYASAKEWSCNISAQFGIGQHQMIHEHLHARSISNYNSTTYINNQTMEEMPVEMFAREICKKEGINIVYSEAYDSIKYLYEVNRIAEISKTDYDFSKELFEVPVIDRRSWIEKRIEEKTDNIGDFERAMKALEKVKFGE